MKPGLSLYLDALRVLAAVTVLVSHVAYPRFSNGDWIWVREFNLGSDAVMLFFVLSGFVIAYTADAKDRTAKGFLFNRFTRIYSVALPAVILTFAIDLLGSRLYPAAYNGWWYGSSEPLNRLFAALTFTSEIGFTHIRIGTNGPYWSLSYEVWYYLLFAALTYTNGARRWLIASAIALVMGPKILILGVAWGAGVAAYHLMPRAANMQAGTAWALFVLPVAVYTFCLAAGMPPALLAMQKHMLGEGFIARLSFSDEFIWNAMIGILVATHLIGASRLANQWVVGRDRGEAVRWLAGGSFSLYIVHYPLLQFLGSAMPGITKFLAGQLLLLALVMAGCYLFAAVFERTLAQQRAWLVNVLGRLSILRPQAA